MPALASWLLAYAVHSTLLLSAAWIVSRCVRSLPVRELAWKTALVGGVLTASLQPLVRPAQARLELEREEYTVLRAPGPPGPSVPSLAPRGPAERRWDWPPAAGAGWLAGAAAALGLLGWRRRDAWRRIGPRRALAGCAEAEAVARLRRAFGVRREVRLTASERIPTPAAIGAGEICVPERVLDLLTPGQRESVLAHEVAHLVRRDPGWRLAADVAVAAFFFQPLNRVARRELRELAELLCDDAVVARTGARRPLAESLARLASVLTAPADPLLSGLTHRDSPLVRRVGRILGAEGPPAEPLPAGRAAALACLLLLPAAGLAPRLPVPVRDLATVEAAPGGDARLAGAPGSLRVSARGAVVDPGTGEVREVRPGGFVRVEERAGASTRRVEVLPGPSGAPRYLYTENGRAAELDQAARGWLARALKR